MTLGCTFSNVKWDTSLATASDNLGSWAQSSVNICLEMTKLTFSFTTENTQYHWKWRKNTRNICQRQLLGVSGFKSWLVYTFLIFLTLRVSSTLGLHGNKLGKSQRTLTFFRFHRFRLRTITPAWNPFLNGTKNSDVDGTCLRSLS